MNQTKALVSKLILTDDYHHHWYTNKLHLNFLRDGYAYLPNLFTESFFTLLKEEVERLHKLAVKKNYRAKGDNTPRNLTAIGGLKLLDESSVLTTFYLHHEFRSLISTIVGAPLFNSTEEEIVGVHYLSDTGETHGWHLDDESYSVTTHIKAPHPDHGGQVECIPNWEFYARKFGYKLGEPLDKYVDMCREENAVHCLDYNRKGDSYLLRSNALLHRVTPLTEPDERIVIVNGFCHTPHPTYTERVTGLYDT